MNPDSKPKVGKTEQTRANIRKAALDLFNEIGTTKVHTHDIAKRAGISPGNLYYHYGNKEEIVRDLFLQIRVYDESTWKERALAGDHADFPSFLDFFFDSVRTHKFFFRDFPILMRNDHALAELWRKRLSALSTHMKKVAQIWVRSGIMNPIRSSADFDAFLDGIWILMNYSSAYLEIKYSNPRREPDDEQELMLRFILPYHTERGRQLIRALL